MKHTYTETTVNPSSWANYEDILGIPKNISSKTKICNRCSKEYEPLPRFYKASKFCSQLCTVRWAAENRSSNDKFAKAKATCEKKYGKDWYKTVGLVGGRKRILKDKVCPTCEKPFRPKSSLTKFCSYECSLKKRPHKGVTVKCVVCSTPVYRRQSRLKEKWNNCCSRKCSNIALLRNKPMLCKICGKSYYRPISQVKARGSSYCSYACAGKGAKLKFKAARFDRCKYPKKLTTFKKWVWKVFSDYIRTRDDWTCFTCGKQATGKSMHAGHFIPRTYSATMFSEINVNAQCYGCNIWKRGNAGEYSIRLAEKYGKEAIDELIISSRETHKFTFEELEELYEKYKGSSLLKKENRIIIP